MFKRHLWIQAVIPTNIKMKSKQM